MPALRLEQLDGHLARELRSLYAIHGDEPLLSLEAADAIRRKGREQGFSERVVLAADRSFDWSELAASAASLSLFGERKMIELRIASGKPGADGARAIETFCGKLPPDALTVVMLPRLDRAGQSSPWFQALESGGVVVNVFPVDRRGCPSGSPRGSRARSKARSPRRSASSPTASKAICSPRTRKSRSSRCSCPPASSTSTPCARR